ncbi:MAG: DUF3307 domain-containing protein [Candidimonas sp.]
MFEIAILFALLSLKHFIADGLLQTPYQFLNKGTLGHPGGIMHAGLHGFGTGFILIFFVDMPGYAAGLAILDMIFHYFIDFSKVKLDKFFGCSSQGTDDLGKKCLRIYSPMYFYLLVADQSLHMATYGVIVALTLL